MVVLTKSEVEHFIENGWVKVEEAYPRCCIEGTANCLGNKQKRGVLKKDPRLHLGQRICRRLPTAMIMTQIPAM